MKRLVALSLIMVMVLFSACGNKESSETKVSEVTKTADGYMENGIKISAPGVFPIVEEPITLKVLILQDPRCSDYEQNKFTKRIEELTGINIEWQLVPQKDLAQKVNLLLAANTDLPDLFLGCEISPSLQQAYGSQGTFVAMNDMIAEHGVELKRVMGLEPNFEKVITSADGKIYGLPQVVFNVNTKVSVKSWIYMPWLEKLGLDKPTTTDELYHVLKAFKIQDPNGNGKADEIPMAGATTGWNQQPQRFLMNSFVFYDEDDEGLYVEDGTIKVSYNQEAFRDGLRYMNKLVSEGLLDATSWTQDKAQLKQLVESEVPIVGTVISGGVHSFSNINGERARGFDTIEPQEGPDGVKISWFNDYRTYKQGQLVITKDCEYPTAALKFADAFFSEELSRWSRFGEPGVDYVINPEGEKDLDGNPAGFKPILEWGSVQNSHWVNRNPLYLSEEWMRSETASDPFALNVWLGRVSLRDYYPYITDNKLPPIVFKEEANEEVLELKATLKSYYRESMTRFILGDLDLEKDWDAYVKELEYIGLDRVIELTQIAYDARWK